jgi:hypothetical protein
MSARSPGLGRLLAGMAVSAVVALSACESGPSGPGTLDGSVTGPANLGAVVLEVTGASVQGFTGQGDTQAYGALVSTAENKHRVILVDRSGGEIHFGIRVDDLGADAPTVTVVLAAGTDNLPKLLSGIDVKVGG